MSERQTALRPDLGFSIEIPPGWTWRRDGDVLAANAIDVDPGLPPHLVVSVEENVDDAGAWMTRVRDRTLATMARARLIDDRPVARSTGTSRRILVDYLHPAFGGAVLAESYQVLGERGVVVSGTTQSYGVVDALAAEIEHMAGSVRSMTEGGAG